MHNNDIKLALLKWNYFDATMLTSFVNMRLKRVNKNMDLRNLPEQNPDAVISRFVHATVSVLP